MNSSNFCTMDCSFAEYLNTHDIEDKDVILDEECTRRFERTIKITPQIFMRALWNFDFTKTDVDPDFVFDLQRDIIGYRFKTGKKPFYEKLRNFRRQTKRNTFEDLSEAARIQQYKLMRRAPIVEKEDLLFS